jgi:hypothetical protein
MSTLDTEKDRLKIFEPIKRKFGDIYHIVVPFNKQKTYTAIDC